MGKPVLARYSIRSKQEFIFRTNRLVEITGASRMIANSFEVLFSCVEEGRLQRAYTVNPDKSRTPVRFDLADVLRRFGESSLDMVELFTGGGNCTLLYRDAETCRRVNMRYTRRILEDCPGMLPMYAGFELEAENGRYNYAADAKKLKEAEEIEKNRQFPARGGYALPFSKIDSVTFQPVSESRRQGADWREFSAESIAKQDYEKTYHQNTEGRSLDDIGRMLAIVHADGNNMGLKIQNLLGSETDYDTCVNTMRQFTEEIRSVYQAGRAELNKAYQSIPPEKGKERYPVRWLISEGDDATFICNGAYAEKLTEAYLRGVRSCQTQSGETYSACAGICVFHAHYPCARAYAIAEQACDNAKKDVHRQAAKGIAAEDGWLDFHVIKSGVGGDLDDLRQLWHLTRKDPESGETENQCMMRPWQVCGSMKDPERDIRKLRTLSKTLEKCGVTRGSLVTLGAVIEADMEQGALEWDKLCYRNDMRSQNMRKSLSNLRRETAALYPKWETLGKALYDLSEVYDLWYRKEAAE